MMHINEGPGASDIWPQAPRTQTEPPVSTSPNPSPESSPDAGTQVSADISLDQLTTPDVPASVISNTNYSLSEIIEKSRSRSTASLLLENVPVTACGAALYYIVGTDVTAFAEGILAQPSEIRIGDGFMPLIKVFCLVGNSVVWSWSGVALVERGWKALLNKLK